MLGESVSDNRAVRMPNAHPRVVVDQLVHCQRQIPVCSLAHIVQLTRRPVGFEHLTVHLHAGAVAEELPGREQVAPVRHAVAMRLTRLVAVRNPLTRNPVQRLPLRQLLGELFPDLRTVVVFGSRGAVAADPLVLPAPAGLQELLDPLLVDDGVELLAHLAVLRLLLDLAAVDDAPAVWVRAQSRPAPHGGLRLLAGGMHDLEGARPVGPARTCAGLGAKSDPDPARREPPVRRQRHEARAVRAHDGAGVEVAHNLNPLPLPREHADVLGPGSAYEFRRQLLKFVCQRGSMYRWPSDCRFENQTGNRIQIVAGRGKAHAQRFHGDASTAGSWIKDYGVGQHT